MKKIFYALCACVLCICGTLIAQGASRPIALSWSASASAGVTGYNVYKGATSGGPYVKQTTTPISGLTFTDQAIIGAPAFYVITAVAPACIATSTICGESAFSAEVGDAIVPSKPAVPGNIILIIQ